MDDVKSEKRSKRWAWIALVMFSASLVFDIVMYAIHHRPIPVPHLIVTDAIVIAGLIVLMTWQKLAFEWRKLSLGWRDMYERERARRAQIDAALSAPAPPDDGAVQREFRLDRKDLVAACIRYVTDKYLPVGNVYQVNCALRSDTFEAVVTAHKHARRPGEQVEVMYTTPTAEELKKALAKRDQKAN